MTDINKPTVEWHAWKEVLFQFNFISCCIYTMLVLSGQAIDSKEKDVGLPA